MGPIELPVGRNEHGARCCRLQRKESEFLFDSNMVGVLFWDPGGRIRDANDAFLRMVGYERADLVSGGLQWNDLTRREWLERDGECAGQQVGLTGSLQPYEKAFFRKDGSRVPVLVETAALDEEGKHGVAFVVEITARKFVEEELRRSQHYLAEAQKVSHTGSWAWSPVSNAILYWSDQCYRIFGFDPTLGLPSFDAWTERIHPEDRPATLVRIDRYARAGNDFELEYRLLLPNGFVRNVRFIAHPVRDASRVAVEFIGIVVDVSEQKRSENARREHRLEAGLQATLNMIPAYTWYANPAGALIFSNERLADFHCLPNDHPHRFGIETGAAWDSHIEKLHPDDHDQARRVWSTCLATGSAGEVSFRVRNAQGAYRWFLSRAEPLRAKDGTLLYWIGINLDIEERKKAELYLAEAQRLSHTGSWAWSPVLNDRAGGAGEGDVSGRLSPGASGRHPAQRPHSGESSAGRLRRTGRIRRNRHGPHGAEARRGRAQRTPVVPREHGPDQSRDAARQQRRVYDERGDAGGTGDLCVRSRRPGPPL
jgi:PAS domain S-box-containing protein